MPPASSKPALAPLKTTTSPKASQKLPSELHDSPLLSALPSAKVELVKNEDLLKTPITPPSAYTDFLNSITPILTSNLPSATTEKSCGDRSICFSQPPSTTTTSTSFSSHGSSRSPAIITIPSPSVSRWPRSARTPRSLRPPAISPTTISPRSAASARTRFSPSEWSFEAGIQDSDSPQSATVSSGRPVRMRQVITRTITYKRTPLDPAPKGKRRKIEDKKEQDKK